jgi:enediyne biosynthesis protein E4
MRSTWIWIGCFAGVVAIVGGGWRWADEQRYQRELAVAEKEVAVGRYRPARDRLAELTKRRPGSSQAAYQLGLCEENLGHAEPALAAWSTVNADSPLYVKTSVARARLLMNIGKLTLAEEVLTTLPRDRGPDATEVGRVLEHLLRLEKRTHEARDVIIGSWPWAADPAHLLKRLYILDDAAFPVDHVKRALDACDQEDDRVWLGRANLATWSGRFEEAARWLDACERRRPDDQPVWLSRLTLAMETRDLAGAARAMRHVWASWFLPSERLRLRAWLANFRGDLELERQSLLALLADEPGNSAAWARLAEMAQKVGRGAEAESFRKAQAEASVLRERYIQLFMADDRSRHAGELSRLARELGRPIEARGWLLVEEGRAATEPLWPEIAMGAHAAGSSEVLAALMGDLLPSANETIMQRSEGIAIIQPKFTDDAEVAGLRFFHDNGHTRKVPPPPETMCGGVGLLDYDCDGWLDLYAVQGGPFPPIGSAQGDGDRLFRNRGDGTFEDTTEHARIASFARGYGHGVTVGDYDNDGRPDLFITRWQSYALYRNKGDGRFEDVTDKSGLGGDRDWPTSAAFADLDGDGDLDLYVCHYLVYEPDTPRICPHADSPGDHTCMPRDYPALPDHVFRNDDGRFVDVTAEAGVVDPDGRGLGVVAANLDDDNKIDLYVANDMSANYLFHNLGALRFEEMGQVAGAAVSADGFYKSGMGIACGDLDGDCELDLAVTNFFGESTTFYRSLGRGLFVDHTSSIGLLAPSRPLLGFGVAFPDVNNDGWLDLISTNGHVLDGRPKIPFTMPLQLLTGSPGGYLTDVSMRAGEPFGPLHLGRGLAFGDLDNDGRLDALVLNQNEPLVYLHNQTERTGHFIRFSLEGTRSNRDAVGARVTIAAGGRRRISERIGGGTYQSANDPRLHFGLGESRQVESVEVRWPSGTVDRHGSLAGDREYRLREGTEAREVKNDPRASSR